MAEADIPETALAAITDHLREVHGRALDPARDISAPGRIVDDAQINFTASRGLSGPQFTCTECPNEIFSAGDPDYGNSFRNSLLRAVVPEVRVAVSGVRGRGNIDLVTEAWDRGELGAITAREVRRTRSMRRVPADRPSVATRRTRCQRYLLDAVARGDTVDDSIARLDALRTGDPDGYATLMCGTRGVLAETLKKYWGAIEPADRQAARDAGARARSARGPDKSTP